MRRMILTVDSFEPLLDFISNEIGDVRNTLAFVGALVAAYYGGRLTLSSLSGLWTHVVSRIWPRNFVKEYGGSWAIVTGPTRGIGKSYAEALARRGMNVALVGRDPTRLGVVRDIVISYGVKCEIFEVDFATDDVKQIESKLAPLTELDIGVLVNNVGWRNSQGPLMLHELDSSCIWPCVTVNCLSVAIMMRLILPGMASRKKGAVVNISSLAAVNPLQLNGLYSAAKAFTDFLSRATELEVYREGITIQTLTPGYIFTGENWNFKRSSMMVPDPDKFVESALTTLGFCSRTSGYVWHDLQFFFLSILGEGFHRFITGRMMWRRRAKFLKEKSQ